MGGYCRSAIPVQSDAARLSIEAELSDTSPSPRPEWRSLAWPSPSKALASLGRQAAPRIVCPKASGRYGSTDRERTVAQSLRRRTSESRLGLLIRSTKTWHPDRRFLPQLPQRISESHEPCWQPACPRSGATYPCGLSAKQTSEISRSS